MPNAKENGYKKIAHNLFRSPNELKNFSELELERKNRTMLCVSKKLENPMISDKDLVDFLVNGCGGACSKVSQSTAYRDIATITRICGNIQLASKAWYRYMVVEGAKEAFAIAKTTKDAKGMAAAIDKIGKYTMADKEDNDFDFDKLIPPSFEPTDNIAVLGEDFEEIPAGELEKKRKELRLLFGKKIKNDNHIEDAEIIE